MIYQPQNLATHSLPVKTVVFSKPPVVRAKLQSLDLDTSILQDVGIAARDYAVTLTPNNPAHSFAQINGSAVRVLRDRTTRHFRRDAYNGVSLTKHHSGDFAILVATGTPDTGDPSLLAKPTNLHKRSKVLADLLQHRSQLTFTSMGVPRTPKLMVFLFHIDEASLTIRSELSTPSTIRPGRHHGHYYFFDWAERIIIPPVQYQSQGQGNAHPGWTPNVAPLVSKKAVSA